MDVKKLLQKLKKPTGGILTVTYLATFFLCAGSIVTLFLPLESGFYNAVCYAVYALAAIFLSYTVYTLIIYGKNIKGAFAYTLRRIPLLSAMLDNFDFRKLIMLLFSMTLTILYGVYNGVLGIIYASIWYGSLAAYYIFLALMRSSVLFSHTRIKKGVSPQTFAIKTYRRCGYALIATILALSAAIAQMIIVNASIRHEGILIYVSAAFTFYNITMSIIDLVRISRRKADFTMQTVVNIKLAESLVSILNLQTAMFYSFGDPTSPLVDIANGLTGCAVCLLIFALGVFMIVRGTKGLRKYKQNQNTTEKIYE